jgi:amidophosphoribosyltransferase
MMIGTTMMLVTPSYATIGVDSLAFVSIDGLYRAMGEARRDRLAPRFCDACFTGDYPIPPVDADNGKHSVQLSLLAAPA